MASTEARPQQRTPEPPSLGEVIIEIGDDKNRNVMFGPTQKVLRGRWSRHNVPASQRPDQGELESMPDIPGMHVSLDPRRRLGKVFDPLNRRENAPLREAIEKVVKEVFRAQHGPEKDIERAELADWEIKSWLDWMRRAVDSGLARVVSGTLPSAAEIRALPGKTRMEWYNSSARATKFREDLPREVA